MTINGYRIRLLTQTFRKLDGHWYRDAWVVQPDGTIALVCVLRDLVDGQ